MNQNDSEQVLFEDLKGLINRADKHELISGLKEKAFNIDLVDREKFEHTLLKLAQEVGGAEIRQVLYEMMASLSSLWKTDELEAGLSEKFWRLFKQGNYEEARCVYSDLAKKGLDYIGAIKIEDGLLRPLILKDKEVLLHYNEQNMSVLDLELNQIDRLELPGKTKILDVLSPSEYSELDMNKVSNGNVKKIWVLTQKENGDKTILSLDPRDFRISGDEIPVAGDGREAHRLSWFDNRLLLVSKNSVFYKENQGWKEWFTGRETITCSSSIKDRYWVGLSNGEVLILKKIGFSGQRERIKSQAESITEFADSDHLVCICADHWMGTADFSGTKKSEFIDMGGRITHVLMLNDDMLIMIQANGSLVGYHIEDKYVLWRFRLGEIFDFVFKIGERIYLGKKNGKTVLFEIPVLKEMAEALERQNVLLLDKPVEKEPDAPVRSISEFIGRREILTTIKNSDNLHFLIAGEPRTGRTSLLNVISDELSGNAKTCYVDMGQILKESSSYKEFESLFTGKCLAQHVLKLEDLKSPDGHQTFRALVEKVRGEKRFCLFCLDNFRIPLNFGSQCLDRLKIFFKEMISHPDVRVLVTHGRKDSKEIEAFFEEVRCSTEQRRKIESLSPGLFLETEVKKVIRGKYQLYQDEVEEIYSYIGRYPNHIHLFDRWKREESDIENYSKQVAKDYSKRIFEYFRDLSPNAFLFTATCFNNQDLMDKRITYKHFYESYPFLRNIIPRGSLKAALAEIENCSEGLAVEYDDGSFSVRMKYRAKLFPEAAPYIPWMKVFRALYQFSLAPSMDNAQAVAFSYSSMVNIGLTSDSLVHNLMEQYKKEFYISRLTQEGRRVLRMPLETFLIIPLKPWEEGKSNRDFNSLYVSIQELLRKSRKESIDETASLKSYILLFVFRGPDFDGIRKGIKGLERVSIIDSHMMRDILLHDEPRQKSSEFIFNQLNISERSPYTTSGAVQDLFYGRELEIALIRGLPENIGIFGTRTIGKTSLLLNLNRDIKFQHNWKAYALDCSRIDSEDSFLKNLAEKMKVSFKEISDIERFRRYISNRAEKEDVQFLFLLDEVDRLVEYDILHGERIFNTFNRMCTELLENGGQAARFILFGFHQMFEQMKNPDSRLYNFMVFLPLKSLDKKSALALVTEPMRSIHVRWENEDRDAEYIVDNCSCHPLLLQSACQSLLSILDQKKENKDMIEREDVERVFYTDQFQQLCMRFYHSAAVAGIKDNNRERKRGWRKFFKLKGDLGELITETPRKREAFLQDIHRVTILATVIILFKENRADVKEIGSFTLTEIHDELKKYGIEISPDQMRKILDHLRLCGIIRLIEEPNLIAPRDKFQAEVEQKIQSIEENLKSKETYSTLKLDSPDIFTQSNSVLKFSYEFGVKAFPRLLVANFDGIEKCKEELLKLVDQIGGKAGGIER